MNRPTAIVTGASRGIGKASAIALAGAGYDVAITARTVHRGDSEFPGSLDETAEGIEAAGGTAHLVPMDLIDEPALPGAAAQCIEALGHVDLLLNNAIYVAESQRKKFLDLDVEESKKRILANVVSQMIFSKPIVAAMVERGSGVVLNMTSAAAYAKPFAAPDNGGWNLAYTVAKGGFHRIAKQLHFEYADRGLLALNVQPGMVATERILQSSKEVARIAKYGTTPAVVGAALAHVATHAADYDPDHTVQLQRVAIELGLIDDVAVMGE